MTKTVRAIHRDGTLRLLEPIQLEQDQEVQVTVATNEEPCADPASAPLARVFGSISNENAKEMMDAIEEAFEQVRLDEWQ